MNGGRLIQHVNGHATGHTHLITNGQLMFDITSTHHQMQYPFTIPNTYYTILYTSWDRMSDMYEGDGINVRPLLKVGEPEIVLYHKKGLPKCLAVQGHPEMIPNSPVAKEISNIVKGLIDANL